MRKGGQPGATCQNSDNLEVVDTKKELAKIAGVSHDTIARVEKIVQKAPEEVKEKLRRNTSVTSTKVDFVRILQKSTLSTPAPPPSRRTAGEAYTEARSRTISDRVIP